MCFHSIYQDEEGEDVGGCSTEINNVVLER